VPDTLVGTDSHTTMINGLGVVGWGVGGIEAEAVMLGQPLYMLMPEVVGFELTGELPRRDGDRSGADGDRDPAQGGVVGKFVEFFGARREQDDAGRPGDDRQHGARVRRDDGLLPDRRRDAELLAPHRPDEGGGRSGRAYCKEQGLFRTDDAPPPKYTKTLSLDLGDVEPSLAGPKRPQDRVPLPR
jgi:aconitate hydratase